VPPRYPVLFASSQRLGPLVQEETFARLYRSREFLAGSLDQPIGLREAAAQACLSPYHYHRMFVRAFGETPHEFLTRVRIDRAKQMLARDESPVTEICLAVGYESLGSFSALFRGLVGRSPSQYREGLRRVFAVPRLAPYRFVPACFLQSFGARPY
jgi:AraC-like DNA-binding protein